jgi:microcystin-dependent protein
MGTPYLCELRLVSFGFPPKGWALANGQTLPINQNQAIFSLLGTTYGGNGQTNFLLPNLQGRVAMHFGGGFNQGQVGGEINHTITLNEMPAHPHVMNAVNGAANDNKPAGHLFGGTTGNATIYGTAAPIPMLSADVSNAGGSQPHENEQPYLVMNWIIALVGIFPSRN